MFGRRTQPPGGQPPKPQPRPQPEQPRAIPSPSVQSPEPPRVNANIFPAAEEFANMLLAIYSDPKGNVHAPTVIGAAAALTGEFAQRAGGIALNNGQPGYVFGDGINEVLLEATNGQTTVWQCLLLAARDAGLPGRDMFDPIEVIKNIADAVGGPSFPPITVPRQHYPLEYSPNACVRLRTRVIAIADQFDLSRRDLAIALATSIYHLVLLTKDVLPPAISVRLAAEIAFGVSKMNPLNEPIG